MKARNPLITDGSPPERDDRFGIQAACFSTAHSGPKVNSVGTGSRPRRSLGFQWVIQDPYRGLKLPCFPPLLSAFTGGAGPICRRRAAGHPFVIYSAETALVGGGPSEPVVGTVLGGFDAAISLTWIVSTGTPRTDESAVRGSAPCLTNAFDQLVWPRGR